MQRPPLFEANCFIYRKNHFETYVKSKDIDLWYIIAYGNYKPIIKDKDGNDIVIPYEKFDENYKKMISKNDEEKLALYNALPKKEYERIFISANKAKSEAERADEDEAEIEGMNSSTESDIGSEAHQDNIDIVTMTDINRFREGQEIC
ncbi:hypothetical protein Tco_0053742 [Tanacetum coccineum]